MARAIDVNARLLLVLHVQVQDGNPAKYEVHVNYTSWHFIVLHCMQHAETRLTWWWCLMSVDLSERATIALPSSSSYQLSMISTSTAETSEWGSFNSGEASNHSSQVSVMISHKYAVPFVSPVMRNIWSSSSMPTLQEWTSSMLSMLPSIVEVPPTQLLRSAISPRACLPHSMEIEMGFQMWQWFSLMVNPMTRKVHWRWVDSLEFVE